MTFQDGGPALEPVLLLADDPPTQERVEAELRKRYGADYQVVAAGSAGAALEVLRGLRDTGRQVALVLAGQWLPGGTGTELLAGSGSCTPPRGGSS